MGDKKMKTISKILIGAVALIAIIVIIGVSLGGGNNSNNLGGEDAKTVLADLGYDDITVDSCSYSSFTNLYGIDLDRLTGEFTSDGITHKYQLLFTKDKEPYNASIDGDSMSLENLGDIVFNYKFGTAVENVRSTYSVISPDEGYVFIPVKIFIKNISYADTFSPSGYNFELTTTDNLSYSYSYMASDYYGDYNTPGIMTGGSAGFTILFAIPENATPSELVSTSTYISLYGLILDETLTV